MIRIHKNRNVWKAVKTQGMTNNWIDNQCYKSSQSIIMTRSSCISAPPPRFSDPTYTPNQLSFSRGDKCNLSLWRDGFILCCYGIILWKSCSVLLFVRLIAQPQTQPTRLLRLLRVPKNRGYISISYFLHYSSSQIP